MEWTPLLWLLLEGKKILSFKPKVTKLWLSGIIHSTRILNVISEIVKLASVAPK